MDIQYIITTFAQNHIWMIMCKIGDYIKTTASYLGAMLGEEVRITPADRQIEASVPIFISQNYYLYKSRLLGQDVMFVFADEEELTPGQAKKVLNLLADRLHCHTILVIKELKSYNIKRWTEQRVNFIVPQKQMFIPSMLVDLKRPKEIDADITETIPAAAQCLILYHLQVGNINGKEPRDLAETLNSSYSTINRALRWLNKRGLITLEGAKTKKINFPFTSRGLWEKALPLLASPIERTVYTDDKIESAQVSGMDAMSEYTMINAEETPCYAVGKDYLTGHSLVTDRTYGNTKLEIWKYSPRLLSAGPAVDKLSLYLSLKDSDDERIQIELDKLTEDIEW